MTSLSTLSSDCAEILRAAAVIGRGFDLDVLASVVARSPLECLDLLGESGRLGLTEADGGPDRHRFADTTGHEAVLDLLAPSERVRLHARAAEAIGTIHADRIDAHLFELAAHWSAAAVGDHRQPAARWVGRAAEAAMDTSAYDDAIRLFRRALDIGGGALDSGDRCRMLLGLATASYRSSDVDGAVAACREAAALAARMGRPDLQANAAVVVEPSLVPEVNIQLRRLCETALTALPESEPGLRVRVTARLADVCHYLGDLSAAHAACAQLIELGRRSGDPRAVAIALHAQQLDVSGPDGVDERKRLAEQLQCVAHQLADPAETASAHFWLIDVALQHGDLARAGHELEQAQQAGADTTDVITHWQLRRAQATLAQAQARYDDASRSADDAAALLTATGNPLGRMIWAGQQTNIHYHVGFDPAFGAKLGITDGAPVPRVLLAGPIQTLSTVLVLTALDRRRDAAAAYRSLGPAVEWEATPHAELFTWSFGILAAIGLEERDDVAVLRRRLDRHRGRHVASGAGCVAYFGPAELWLGVAEGYLGAYDTAVGDLQHAIDLCSANGAAGFHAQAQLELARVHAARGSTGDAQRTRALVRAALGRAEMLGMPPLAAAARELLRSPGAQPCGGLTGREREVAALVAAGLTNRAIAQRLYLSERTAANHVQHILDKLDLANRSQIASLVSGQQLSTG
jgi:DNA-binding CsgD family transcriptional regulator/tetratricopeptide (TPR) repeat protein